MKKPADHVIVNQNHRGLLQCLHCGGTSMPNMPAPIDVYTAMLTAFTEEHRNCELRPEGMACVYCLGFGHEPKACEKLKAATPEEWLAGPDKGMSSETICRVALGQIPDHPSPPQDVDDFGRCYRLLKLFPAFRARLPDVAAQYPAWSGLVREWDALTALYEEEEPSGRAPKLYRRMKELLKEAQDR